MRTMTGGKTEGKRKRIGAKFGARWEMSMIPNDAAGDCTINRAKNKGNRTKLLCHLNCSFSFEVLK